MTNIIILNGPCWIGKSTISKLLHTKIPHAYLREKDAQRRLFSQYKNTKEDYQKSGKNIIELTKHIISFCIKNNETLIFEWLLHKEEHISILTEHIKQQWWTLHHFCLNAPKDIRQKRIEQRGVSWILTFEKAEIFYDKIQELLQKEQISKQIININTENTDSEAIVQQILHHIY